MSTEKIQNVSESSELSCSPKTSSVTGCHTQSPKPSTSRATVEDLNSHNSIAKPLEQLYFSPTDIREKPQRQECKANTWTDTPNKQEQETEWKDEKTKDKRKRIERLI